MYNTPDLKFEKSSQSTHMMKYGLLIHLILALYDFIVLLLFIIIIII